MPSNKSEQAKQQSAERLRKQKERGSTKFGKSNPHHGASTGGQSGTKK